MKLIDLFKVSDTPLFVESTYGEYITTLTWNSFLDEECTEEKFPYMFYNVVSISRNCCCDEIAVVVRNPNEQFDSDPWKT